MDRISQFYGLDYTPTAGQDSLDIVSTENALFRQPQRFERWKPNALATNSPNNHVGVFGKLLGGLGLDTEGRRAAASWEDATKNTLSSIINFPQDTANQFLDLRDYGGAYGTGPGADPARAQAQNMNVFGLAGLAPLASAGLSRAGALEARGASPQALYANSKEGALPGVMLSRSVDDLGYYSQALEAARSLKQAKGTPEQMLAQLKAAGVKDAEIAATKLKEALEGKSSITRDEIVKHLEGNRVGLKEAQYHAPTRDQDVAWADALEREGKNTAHNQAVREELLDLAHAVRSGDINGLDFQRGVDQAGLLPGTVQVVRSTSQDAGITAGPPKWSSYSLDPSNPTYRETVLHLPVQRADSFEQFWAAYRQRFPEAPEAYARQAYEQGATRPPDAGQLTSPADPTVFRSGHFPEPNIIGHMMTSMTEHPTTKGKVYTIDQIQSDWGQKLRDGGVRDEAKIAGLQSQLQKVEADLAKAGVPPGSSVRHFGGALRAFSDDGKATTLSDAAKRLWSEQNRISAELMAATASSPGHPLVNTTDQWTNTTLRRALKQAVDADAEYVAIPSGDTVLSYNPGDTAGMNAFYGKIIPKNLNNILRKYDPAYPGFSAVEQLQTTNGLAGQGFSVFPLTDQVRSVVRSGQPLFVNPREAAALGLLYDQEQQPNALAGYR